MSIRPTERQLEQLRQHFYPFVDFTPQVWAPTRELFKFRQFGAGTRIVTAGSSVFEIGFLLSGLTRFYYTNSAGLELNIDFASQGQMLTSISAVSTGSPSPFSIETIEPCSVLFIKQKDLQRLSNTYGEWERLSLLLLQQLAVKQELRQADRISLSKAERYAKFLNEFSAIAARIPDSQIASYLAVSEAELQAIRKRLDSPDSPDQTLL